MNARGHCLAAWGIAAAAAILAGLVLWLPAHSLQRSGIARAETLQLERRQLRRDAARLDALQTEVRAMRESHPEIGDFLQGESPAIVAADLQRQVEDLIEAHTGHVISMQPLDEPGDELFPRATVKVQMYANVETLQKILYALETGRPRLFLDDVLIWRRNPEQLEVRLHVTGYVWTTT